MLSPAWLSIGLFSLLGNNPAEAYPLEPIRWPSLESVSRWQSPWVLQRNAPDPQAAAIVQQHLMDMSAAGGATETQGIWIQTGGTAIAASQGDQALPAASLTKLATTLAALHTWNMNHRFETLVGRIGEVRDGVLEGDLVVRWEGDPYFVWEEAIALGNALEQAGIQRVTGNLVILGSFAMNFDTDPYRAGDFLMQALNREAWSDEVWGQYAQLPEGTPQPNIPIEGTVVVKPLAATSQVSGWVIRHQSLHLVALLKAMNIYSNNEMSEILARAMGGAAMVTATVVEKTQISPAEIRLINGSGLGVENQISPRAVVAILVAIQRDLHPYGFSISDVMPVFGQDVGTLAYRDLPRQSALKTGTLNAVSSLAGYFPTRDRGPVWFSIQNQGYDLGTFRTQQDALLKALQAHWGTSTAPADFQSKVVIGQAPYQLGDSKRNLPY